VLIGVFLLAACSSSGPADPGAGGSPGQQTPGQQAPGQQAPGQQLGVGGVAKPANAVLTTRDSKKQLNIDESGSEGSPRVYDGQGHTVGTIDIRADWVVVQNFKVQATGQYGIDSQGTHITIQNNDIKGVKESGNGDLNAITFVGDYHSIRYNTAIDFVSGDPGDSHTDGIQTWNDDPGESSSHVVIQGNYFSGPLTEGKGDDSDSYIHQCVMAEGAESTDGGGGGTGASRDWLIAGNYCVGDMKFDDIDNVTVTGNEFAGVDKRVVVVTPLSSGFEFYSDNKITGKYGQVGVEVKQGNWTGTSPIPETPGASAAGTSEPAFITAALVLLGLAGLAALLIRRASRRRGRTAPLSPQDYRPSVDAARDPVGPHRAGTDGAHESLPNRLN
jgi:hypothetical protein